MPILVGLHQLEIQECGEVSKVVMETGSPTKGIVVHMVEILVMVVNLGTGSHHLAAEVEEVLPGLLLGDKEESASIMRVDIAGRGILVIFNTLSCRAKLVAEKHLLLYSIFQLHG